MKKRTKAYMKTRDYLKTIFPKKNEKVVMSDFFQTDVDAFMDGVFRFLKAKKVKVKVSEKTKNKIDSINTFGYKVYLKELGYEWESPHTCLVVEYKSKGWENNYHIRAELASANNCDCYSQNESIEDFADWMKPYLG